MPRSRTVVEEGEVATLNGPERDTVSGMNGRSSRSFDRIADRYDDRRGGSERGVVLAADIDPWLSPGSVLEVGVVPSRCVRSASPCSESTCPAACCATRGNASARPSRRPTRSRNPPAIHSSARTNSRSSP
jgi:hypothetical protein